MKGTYESSPVAKGGVPVPLGETMSRDQRGALSYPAAHLQACPTILNLLGVQVLSPTPSPAETTLAHVLLHDPLPKVRQAAAVTIATLLEGPAQRAYLGIAECTDWERQPVR